jgi:hypothetical protein
MAKKTQTDLITLLQPIFTQRLFPILLGIILLGSIYRFAIEGIYQPITVPSVDYELYYNWIHHRVAPPVWGTFMPPFVPFPYSPFWGIIMAPFGLFSYPVSKQLWYFCNLAIVFWFIYQSMQWLREYHVFEKQSYISIVLPLVIFLNFVPIVKTLRTGQANILVLLFTTISFLYYQKGQKIASGSFLAMAILTKITPIFLILFWLVKKEFRVVLSTFLSMIILVILSIPFCGIQMQTDYIHWITTYPFQFFGHSQILNNNMSIYALIADIAHSLHLTSSSSITIFILFLIFTLSLWYYLISFSKNKNTRSIFLEYGLTLSMIPLLTQYTEDHHFVYVCFLYAALMIHLNKNLPHLVWISAGLSWILINCTFFLYDLNLVPINNYLFRYIYMYGVLLAWITGGYILFLLKVNKDSEHD